MAKIIKVGSQNPTFTSQSKKAGSIQTHRNSNEATNPFKFTNFEGNTLQFADVFEGFKPTFKASPTNKLRLVASSVTGSMNKMRSSITESIANFANRICTQAVNAWGYVRQGWDYAKNTNVSEVPGIKNVNNLLNTQIKIPGMDKIVNFLNKPASIPVIDGLSSKMESLKNRMPNIQNMMANISFHGKNKYAEMSVLELETALKSALAEGGINE